MYVVDVGKNGKSQLKQFDVEISHHCTSSLTAFISLEATSLEGNVTVCHMLEWPGNGYRQRNPFHNSLM